MYDREQLVLENEILKKQVFELKKELEFLKLHPVFAQGLKGERLIAEMTGGTLTDFSASHDVETPNGSKIEVKFSKLNSPSNSRTRRWNWSKPLGWKDKGKDFDYLLLVGDKDHRFESQYPDSSPYVFFLIPRAYVEELMSSGGVIGSAVQIVTNLQKAKSPKSLLIKKHLVSFKTITEVLRPVGAP